MRGSDLRRARQAGFADVALDIPILGFADMRWKFVLVAFMLFEIGDGTEGFSAKIAFEFIGWWNFIGCHKL